MKDLQVFNFKNNQVRVVEHDRTAWFVAKDVAKALQYTKTRNAIAEHVDKEDKTIARIFTEPQNGASGQMREVTIINEAGVYSLIFSSKLPAAKEFKHWVTHEVLPDIRKYGFYLGNKARDAAMVNKEEFDAVVKNYLNEKDRRQALEDELRDKQSYTTLGMIVAALPGAATIADAAQFMRQHGLNKVGRNILYAYGRNKGYLCKQKKRWNLPNQKGIDDGLFCLEIDGSEYKFTPRTMVTAKGLDVLLREFIENEYPLIALMEEIKKDGETLQANI